MFNLCSGVDLVEIDRLEKIRPEIRDRFLERVYTEWERAEVGSSPVSLAGRFAAKEAVAKALGCGIGPVSWQEIEVRRGQKGEPVLYLYGNAQVLADELHIQQWSISISHTRTHAIAFVIGLGS